MGRSRQRILFGAAAVLLLLLAAATAAGIWLYEGRLTPAKEAVFERLPLPMAFVDKQPLLARDFLFRRQLAARLPAAGLPSGADGTIYSQLISENEISQLLAARDLSVSGGQTEKAYQDYAAQDSLSGQTSFENLLKAYGLSTRDFTDQVVRPQLELVALQTWFYSQPSLNRDAYGQAQDLLARINAGQDFGSLAAQYSQDSTGRSLQGDLGFIETDKLLPELQEAADSLQVGQTVIAPSRNGLQILQLAQKNGNLLHLRQIYIQGADFNAWLSAQKQNFRVIKLLNI